MKKRNDIVLIASEHMQSAILVRDNAKQRDITSYDVSGLKHSGRYANRAILASCSEGGIFRDIIIIQFFPLTKLHTRAAKQEDIIFLVPTRERPIQFAIANMKRCIGKSYELQIHLTA